MRSTVDLPDELIEQARALSGIATKRDVIVAALEEFVRRRRVERLRSRLGTMRLDLTQDDLRRMRVED
jgi:hypothetical protein